MRWLLNVIVIFGGLILVAGGVMGTGGLLLIPIGIAVLVWLAADEGVARPRQKRAIRRGRRKDAYGMGCLMAGLGLIILVALAMVSMAAVGN